MARKIIAPRRSEVITEKGLASKRLSSFLEQLTVSTNDNTTIVENITINTGSSAKNHSLLSTLSQRIGSGQPLSWDETGFEFSSSRITLDRTET